MYVMVVFALALLSPLPFISPFEYNVQDATAQSPFGPSDSTAPPSNHQIEIDAANIIITELSHTFRASGSSITAGSPNFMHPVTVNLMIGWRCSRIRGAKWRLSGSILHIVFKRGDKW